MWCCLVELVTVAEKIHRTGIHAVARETPDSL
jgi:hypothetical protein